MRARLNVSLECDQILRISLNVMEDNEHVRVSHVVHDTVVDVYRVARLVWWHDHV